MNYYRKYWYVYVGIMIIFCGVIVWYTQFYIPKHHTSGPAKEVSGTGVIKDIKFVPTHEETSTYTTYNGTGRYRTPVQHSRTYTVQNNYTITIYINELDKEEKYQCFNLAKGEKFKVNDQVKLKYKETDAFWTSFVTITKVEKL